MIKQTLIAIGMMTVASTAFAAQGQADHDTNGKVPGSQHRAESSNQSFNSMDTNGNGEINWSEGKAGGMSKQDFNSADTNQDNMMGQSEYKTYRDTNGKVPGPQHRSESSNKQ